MQVMKLIAGRVRDNWQSGLTVSLISIPLSVSLAVASQATPLMGILTAIWAGLLASIFGGSRYNIVGPTGALSGILGAYALVHGAQALPMLAITTGLFILIAYAAKLERFLLFVPASAIHGFTLGVACIIGLNQLNFALGLTHLPAHERFIQNIAESLRHIPAASPTAVVMFSLFLLGLFVFARWLPRVPGAIVLSPIGIAFGWLSVRGALPFSVLTLGDKFPGIEGRLFVLPTFYYDDALISAGIAVAIVAILETLISAKIADGMTKTKHNKHKEMLGLGLANIASGLAGGLPATAALARTALNIKTGATHRMSSTVNVVFVALISLLFLKYFVYIPLPVVAAILVFVAVRMVAAEHFLRFWHHDRKNFAIACVVAGITIYVDPILGILFGTAISLLVFVEKLSRGQFELVVNNANKQIVHRRVGETWEIFDGPMDVLVYSIKGQLAYINAASHVSRFEQGLGIYNSVVLRMRELSFIDLDGVDAFEEIVELIRGQGRQVFVSGVNPLIQMFLEDSPVYMSMKRDGLVFEHTSDVLHHLGYKVASQAVLRKPMRSAGSHA